MRFSKSLPIKLVHRHTLNHIARKADGWITVIGGYLFVCSNGIRRYVGLEITNMVLVCGIEKHDIDLRVVASCLPNHPLHSTNHLNLRMVRILIVVHRKLDKLGISHLNT